MDLPRGIPRTGFHVESPFRRSSFLPPRSSIAIPPRFGRTPVCWTLLGSLLLTAPCACHRQEVPLSAPTASTPPVAPPSSVAPPPDAGAALSVAELLRRRPDSGTFVIEGFITRVQTCPPCPKGAECKPCMPDHAVVSDQSQPLDSYANMGPQDVIVFVPSPTDLDAMRVGQRRRLTVRVTREQTTNLPVHDLELVELGPLT